MSGIESYKDLLIWQKGIVIVKEIYLLCAVFPKNEVYGLQSQMKRASISWNNKRLSIRKLNYYSKRVEFNS